MRVVLVQAKYSDIIILKDGDMVVKSWSTRGIKNPIKVALEMQTAIKGMIESKYRKDFIISFLDTLVVLEKVL